MCCNIYKALKRGELRGVDVSRVVDLFEFIFGEFTNAVGHSVDVEMAYYIAHGVFGVLGYIMSSYIRFWKCIIKV